MLFRSFVNLPLRPVDDKNTPLAAHYFQIAVRTDSVVRIYRAGYDGLDVANKAALLVHEIVYGSLLYENDSDKARAIVAYLFDRKNQQSADDILKIASFFVSGFDKYASLNLYDRFEKKPQIPITAEELSTVRFQGYMPQDLGDGLVSALLLGFRDGQFVPAVKKVPASDNVLDFDLKDIVNQRFDRNYYDVMKGGTYKIVNGAVVGSYSGVFAKSFTFKLTKAYSEDSSQQYFYLLEYSVISPEGKLISDKLLLEIRGIL